MVGAQVVGGAVVLGVAGRRKEKAGSRIELPSGQELQGEIGVSGASHAEVDLEGGQLPVLPVVLPVNEEVHGKAAHRAVAASTSPIRRPASWMRSR